jgi:hypothetical protein
LTDSEAKFSINVREGFVQLEGKETFVDKHLDKFEEIFKAALKEAIARGLAQSLTIKENAPPPVQLDSTDTISQELRPVIRSSSPKRPVKSAVNIHPVAVDLKANNEKPGLREFYADKRPLNHYEKTVVFAYYLTKFNREQEIRFGEILSCYEEVDEKKPSIVDIIKNTVRYKGWLENATDRYSCRLTISGENFVKFDLPATLHDKQAQAALI